MKPVIGSVARSMAVCRIQLRMVCGGFNLLCVYYVYYYYVTDNVIRVGRSMMFTLPRVFGQLIKIYHFAQAAG